MLKKLACFTGWVLVLTLSLLFCFTLGLWQGWSTPSIFLLWLALLLLTLLLWGTVGFFTKAIREKKHLSWLKKYRLSRREFVLHTHWKYGSAVIKRIRRRRSPLAWYLLLGDRCGKSTLLASAGLPRFDGDHDGTFPGPTRTLRWWFFRQTAILDLSSNFINGNSVFRQAWGKLAQWCSRMPMPAGIIIAVPIDALMNDNLSELHLLARKQRALIEPLIRRFGEHLPLHVIVTQCDRFPGFTLWHQQLSDAQRQQPLGYSWPTPPHIDGQDERTLHALFGALKRGMSRVRLSMMSTQDLSAEESAILLDFPETFAGLEPKLRYALASLCEPNAYFSHVQLNSVWFCATEPQAENRGRRIGVFIQDLVAVHLHNFSLSRQARRWYQRSHGKSACTLTLVALALWITVSAALSVDRLRIDLEQLSAEKLAVFLAQEENYPTFALRYLPFQPLLNLQYQRATSRLTSLPSSHRDPYAALAQFQQQALDATPENQRTLILQLTRAILLGEQMRQGISLDALSKRGPAISALRLRNYEEELPPLTILALERHYMQSSVGERWLQEARQILSRLVNHDPALNWLTVAGDLLPKQQANAFWPSLPENFAISSIWTLAGQTTFKDWMNQIERAIGEPQIVFNPVRQNNPVQRQNAWKKYLLDVTAHLASMAPAIMPHERLIAMGQNQSQSMQFIEHIIHELSDIRPAQAQPWLMTMRQLQQLATNEQIPALLNRAMKTDNAVRQSLTAWLQGAPSEPMTAAIPRVEQAWRQWAETRNRAVKEAVAFGTAGNQLTRGLFHDAPNNEGQINPLPGLFTALNALQELISPRSNDPGTAAVWMLYREDAHHLLGNALTQSACWLNTQWRTDIIWPLNNAALQYRHDDRQARSRQAVEAFLRGPAKNLLTSDSAGLTAADFGGMKVPLSESFIYYIRQVFSPEAVQDVPQRATTRADDRRAALLTQRDALIAQLHQQEKISWKTSVVSQPATVPGGAKIIPTGVQLTLNCQKGDQQLSSMNFAEKREFSWQAGQCSGVTLDVLFPDFTARHQITGDDAWPWFINSFNNGEMLLDSNEFGDKSKLLQQMGIKQILVRFAIEPAPELEAAWQSWSDIADSIHDLDTLLKESHESEPQPLPPISMLPDNIAQCP
ncbi:hypothetical protein F3J29_09915 [Enterobacter sp. Cy-643]|uniref:type VI secretion protein IcmF/TssM N-terminal domain-containing protein n=1 Tax=Enterobacter sp. Cy-643 TaxID=2608346 RepID=UPI00141DE388|nr:type VI secretion protein IcmF/TssM N-terminal domain-containing protein [Enterobacter sp. Cy-643]NIF32454.1 hypothetical protein [Enterobacter sp. Cy-643]